MSMDESKKYASLNEVFSAMTQDERDALLADGPGSKKASQLLLVAQHSLLHGGSCWFPPRINGRKRELGDSSEG
jgi:hypothetical protein